MQSIDVSICNRSAILPPSSAVTRNPVDLDRCRKVAKSGGRRSAKVFDLFSFHAASVRRFRLPRCRWRALTHGSQTARGSLDASRPCKAALGLSGTYGEKRRGREPPKHASENAQTLFYSL